MYEENANPVYSNENPFVFNESAFEDAVVKPWYRQNKIQHFFYVAEILHRLNPLSAFPQDTFKSFDNYYQEKYDIRITNKTQPLLDVDHTSARLNLLTPRYVNRKGITLPMSAAKTKKEKRENMQEKQILIPELCIVHPFPASFWRKAVCLPCDDATKPNANHEDFVIDTFVIPDSLKMQDDEPTMDDLEMVDAMFGVQPLTNGTFDIPVKAFGTPLGLWENVQKYPVTNGVTIREVDDNGDVIEDGEIDDTISDLSDEPPRYGSPSNFETTFNDVAWDEQANEEADRFLNLNIGGIEKISFAGGEFNIDAFREDLEKSVFDDEYGSEDEVYDDEDDDILLENNASYKNTVSGETIELHKDDQLMSSGELDGGLLDDVPVLKSDAEDIERIINENFAEPEEAFNIGGDKPSSSKRIHSMLDNLPALKKCKLSPLKDVPQMKAASKVSTLKFDVDFSPGFGELLPDREDESTIDNETMIRFDAYKSECKNCVGPSPSTVLQALTMSNASDGINLERLETVGDSFLKYAITAFLFCMCPQIHEGKLSWLRSRQISNRHLYFLGKKMGLGEFMTAIKFEPSDNWLPPCYVVPEGLDSALTDIGIDSSYSLDEIKNLNQMSEAEIRSVVNSSKQKSLNTATPLIKCETFNDVDEAGERRILYNLKTRQSIPDKSIADCVEALIGAYLLQSGPRGALLFMKSLGLKVMPKEEDPQLNADDSDSVWHWLPNVKSPLLPLSPGEGYDERSKMQQAELRKLYAGNGLDNFERIVLKYEFRDKAYLVQAFTHNSYYENKVTDCYQRLEFLGDAVLDFLITRHLYEDKQKHSPGALTDLRSALVNNTLFAMLAVRYDFNKYMKLLSPDLFKVISNFVQKRSASKKQAKTAPTSADVSVAKESTMYVGEDECENTEDVEVPKALGDIFESVAGAVFLDSGMSLDAVWRVFFRMMRPEIEYYSKNVPKSPIRELLEMEPQNVQFGPPKVIQGKKVQVQVEVFGVGKFNGVGRNKRIAKCTAAKRALVELKKKRKAV